MWGAEEVAQIIAVMCLTGWLPLLVWWKHRIRLEEIRNQRNSSVNEETIQALRELQREMRELRDTTTKFDMSFDHEISRLEQRVAKVEPPVHAYGPVTISRNGITPQEPTAMISVGQGER